MTGCDALPHLSAVQEMWGKKPSRIDEQFAGPAKLGSTFFPDK